MNIDIISFQLANWSAVPWMLQSMDLYCSKLFISIRV